MKAATKPRPRPWAELAHDLRHPLAMILLWEQIARRCNSDEMRAEALDAIRQAALEQSTIIDRLAQRDT